MARVVGRMKGRTSFRALARPDGRARRGPLSVAYKASGPDAPDTPPFPVVGYAVGRRNGSAVRRNRLRRRLRAATRLCAAQLAHGTYLVRAEPPAAEAPFDELCRALREAALAASGARRGVRS